MCIRDRANTEANIEVQETHPTTEMEVETNNSLENQQEETPPAEPEQSRQTERVTQTGIADFQEWMKKMIEETVKNNESLNKNMESINKNMEALKEDSQKNMESLNKKIDDNSKALKGDLNTKLDDISKKMEENNEKINTKIDREITVVRREIAEVHERCEQHSQDLQRTREKRLMDESTI